jgi:hypothetical protein
VGEGSNPLALAIEAADPKTPGARLVVLAAWDSFEVRDAAMANPSLPLPTLASALSRGHEAAFANPAILLHLLSGEETGVQGRWDYLSLREAMIEGLWRCVAYLLGFAPERGGHEVVGSWLGAVAMACPGWEGVEWCTGEVAGYWRDLADGEGWLNANVTEELIRQVADYWLAGESEALAGTLLRLVTEVRALPLDRSGNGNPEPYLTAICQAAELLGYPVPEAPPSPQLSLFEAA